MKNIHKINENIYITSDEEIKEGDWYENNGVIFKADDVFDEGNNPNNSNPKVTYFNIKIILTTDKDLIDDGVQAIDDEFLQWFVKNPNCDEVKLEYRYNFYAGKYLTHYKIIIPKEETTAYHYLSCCRSVEECHCGKYPKQIKCYCGHTTMCDCSPIDEPKQEEIDFYAKELMLEKERAYKQQTLEEAAHKMLMDFGIMSVGESINVLNVKKLMVLFAKEQQERSYSEEDMFEFSQWISHEDWVYLPSKGYWVNEEQEELEQKLNSKEILNMWFEKFKKK